MLNEYKNFLNEDYVNSVTEALDGNLKMQGDVVSNSTKDHEFWLNFKSEDDYKKWSADWLNTEGKTSAEKVAQRQEIYQSNKDRIDEIEKTTGSNWFSEYFGGLRANINDAIKGGVKSETYAYDALLKEKEALEAENLRYERTQGAMDKHYIPITNEVEQIASNRDFSNASADELWGYDAVAQDIRVKNLGYDYDGNMVDGGGNIVYDANHPIVKAMRENNLDGFYDSVIEDKLGMYLSASQEDLDLAYERLLTDNQHDTWAILLNEGVTNAWDQLDETEITIYYHKLNTEGQASAYKFLEDMTVELTRRATQKRAEEINKAPLFEQILLNAASIPMNVLGGAVGLVGDVANAIEGKEYNPYSAAHSWSNDASAIRQDTASDINNATGNAALPWVGTTFGDVYQSIMSAGDSVMASFIPGGHYLLGLNAASAEMKDLYERGASTEQMLAGGILAGAAESFFEKYSIGELNKLKNMDSKAVKNFADGFVRAMVMGGVEASEEMATEIANTISDALVMGSQTDWKDLGTFVKNVVNAGIGGFISGGLMGGAAAKINNIKYNQNIKQHGQEIIKNDGVDALKQLALEVYSDKGGLDALRGVKAVNKVADKATAKNVGKLSDQLGDTITKQNRTDIQKALVEKGLSKKEASLATAYITNSNELSEQQVADIEGNEHLQTIIDEVLADPNLSVSDNSFKLALARSGVDAKKATPASKASTQQAENTSVTENATAEENATEVKFEASEVGKTIVKETGAEVNVEDIVSNEGGNLMVKLDNGETVNARDLAFATAEEGLIYEMVANMGVNPKTAMALVKAYNPASGVKAQTYAMDIPVAYKYGKVGYEKGLERLNLTPEQRYTAYVLGRDDVKASGRTWSDTSRKTPETNKSKAAEDGIIYDGFELNEDSLTDIQKASLEGIRTIAKMSPSLEIHITDSVIEDGKKYVMVNGQKKLAKNGVFKNGNEIYIDLNAGRGTMGTMLYTMSHEVVHFIAENSFEDFQALADFLFEHYGEKNVPVDTLIKREMDILKKSYKAEGKALPGGDALYMKAYEEVVANAMSKMLADPTSYEKLAKLKSENLSLWEKIGEAIKRMLDKLKSMLGIYEGHTPDAMAAHYVDDFSTEVYNKLQDLYLKAFVNADKNYQASIGSRNLEDFADAKNTEGESLFQYKAMEADEDTYRDMLKKWGKMTDSQISNLFLTIDNAMELIKDNLEALDYAWEADIDDRAFSPVKPNSDKLYQVSLDFSTLCRKRILQQTVQAQLQEALDKALTREEGIAIRDALIAIQEEGRQIEVACALCYVESARMKSPEQIRKFIANKEQVIKEFFAGKSGGSIKEKISKAETNAREKLHKENPNGIKGKDGSTMLDPRTAKLNQLPKKYADMIRSAKKEAKASYTPTAEEQRLIEVAKGMTVSDFTSPEGLENLAKNYRDLFDAYTSYVRNATKSKGIESDTWWRAGDSMQIGDVLIANMNKENGLRSQSWSDFQVIHILDYIAATIELATRNTKEQAYTKVPDFAELMGQTGVMINLSLIPTAKFNGKLEYDSKEGIDYKRSLELRDKYHATVGTICIGIDNVQIQMLLGDITVDYVIPYHKSGMSAVIRKAMHIPTWSQYEEYQSEKNLAKADAKKQADKYGVKLLAENDPNYHKHPNFSDWFDIKEAQQIAKMENANPTDKAKQKKYGVMYGGYMAMQNAANNYLKLCAERGISPKFSHEKADFTTEENYWKLLIDRKMVDNVTGEVIEQQTIKPIFDEAEVMRILNDELERYPKVKEDQEYAIRKVTEAYLSGDLKGGMSAKDIAKVMQTPVDNVTNTNIIASAEGDELYSVDDYSDEEISYDKSDFYKDSKVYSYDFLVNQKDMKVLGLPALSSIFSNKKIDRNHIISEGKKNALAQEGSKAGVNDVVYVQNKYTKRMIEVNNQSIRHGIGGEKHYTITNARLGMIIGDIIHNGIPINELKPSSGAESTYAMIAYAVSPENKPFLAIAHIDVTSGKLVDFDAADTVHSLRGRIQKGSTAAINSAQGLSENSLPFVASEISISQLLDFVNSIQQSILSEDVLNHLNETRNPEGYYFGEVLHSAQDPSSVSTRSLLANALESTVQNDIEKTKLAQYKSKIELIEKEQAKLTELRAKIKELSFAKGARDAKAIKALQFEANEIANRINTYDRQLLNLESTTALKNVLQREKKLAYDKAKKEGKDALAKYREKAAQTQRTLMDRQKESRLNAIERRDKTVMRRKIHNLVKDLNSLFKNGTKQRNIKQEMQKTVATSLALAEVIFNDDIKNEDIVRLGVDSVTEKESILLNEYRDLLDMRDDLEAQIEATYGNGIANKDLLTEVGSVEEKLAKVKNRISTLNGKLSEVFERERARLNKATMDSVIDALITEYSKLANSGNDYIKNAYSEHMKTRLETLKNDLQGTVAKDMSIYQLAEVYDTFKSVKHMISTANSLFFEERNEELMAFVSNVQGEMYEYADDNPKDPISVLKNASDKLDAFAWNELKPVYAFDKLGSETFKKLFWDVIEAEGKYAVMIDEARAFNEDLRKKHGFAKWDLDTVVKEFTLADGKVFKLTLEDMMSIYAYSRRTNKNGVNQSVEHMTEGGFVFDENSEYKPSVKGFFGKFALKRKHAKLTTTYRIDNTVLKAVKDFFNDKDNADKKAYVEAMQDYMTAMGEKGNEVSRKLFGIDIFTELVYMPLQSSADYLNSNAQALSKTPTQASLKNVGMSKPTTPGANNPIVLQAFDEVWFNHIDQMSKYVSLVLPIENLQRVFNNVAKVKGDSDISTQALIEAIYGKGARQYIDQYITDLNGGIMSGGYRSPLLEMFGRAKKTAVAASLSVWSQQYFAIVRAMDMIRPDYFVPFLRHQDTSVDMSLYEEMRKYAPVAIIKEMGSFDVGSGRSAKSFMDNDRRGFKGKMEAFDEYSNIGAEVMDKLGWMTIWSAVKKEVATEQKLTPGTEEFFAACKKRFTEVIVYTQVYDSTNSRSGLMRSKSDLDKFATSFMGEPTVSVNMVDKSLHELKRAIKKKDKKAIGKAAGKLGRTLSTVTVSIALSSLAKAMIGANRDDEEDEAWLEKWMKHFGSNLVSELNPLGMMPYTRDIVSLWEGWSVDRPDMDLIGEVVSSIKKCLTDGATIEEVISLSGDIANAFGVPAKNIVRDVKGIINFGKAIFDDIHPTDVGGAFVEGITGEERTKQTSLYNAIIGGDTGKIDAIKDTYDSDSAYKTAVKTALRDNDSRIKEAAKAHSKGDIRSYGKYIDTIVAEGHFDAETVEAAIRSEQSAFNTKINEAAEALNKGEDAEYKKIVRELRDSYKGIYSQDDIVNLVKKAQEELLATNDDEDVEEATSIYKASDVNAAFESGDTDMALEVINDLINTKVENYLAEAKKEAEESGKRFNEKTARQEAESKAKSSIRSSMTTYWKPLYKEAYKSKNTAEQERIKKILKDSGMYGNASEVIKTCREWRTERD